MVVRKNLTPSVGFYDSKERLGALSQVEVVAREEAKAEFRKWGTYGRN